MYFRINKIKNIYYIEELKEALMLRFKEVGSENYKTTLTGIKNLLNLIELVKKNQIINNSQDHDIRGFEINYDGGYTVLIYNLDLKQFQYIYGYPNGMGLRDCIVEIDNSIIFDAYDELKTIYQRFSKMYNYKPELSDKK